MTFVYAFAALLIQGSAALIALAWPAAQLANNGRAKTDDPPAPDATQS